LQMSGTFKVDSGGKVEFQEEDGIDYAPVTVQLPGGERVPFLFTVKELSAKGSLDGFGGDFTVPSYRGSSFLDPKVVSIYIMQKLVYLSAVECLLRLGSCLFMHANDVYRKCGTMQLPVVCCCLEC